MQFWCGVGDPHKKMLGGSMNLISWPELTILFFQISRTLFRVFIFCQYKALLEVGFASFIGLFN
jgi:hypothetical protein